MDPCRLLIDTDPGVDDALAILMAHAHADVAALTIATGNVGLGQTTANALKLIEVIGADTPVYPGCPVPLAPRGGIPLVGCPPLTMWALGVGRDRNWRKRVAGWVMMGGGVPGHENY